MQKRTLYLKNLVTKPAGDEGGGVLETDKLLVFPVSEGDDGHKILASIKRRTPGGELLYPCIGYPSRKEAQAIIEAAGGISHCERW